MNLLESFAAFIKSYQLQNKSLLLAVSGGVDSVVLCELCERAELDFAIAHCNFGLRGKESDRDEEFVGNLCSKYSTPVYSKRFNTKEYAEANKLSIQEAARNLRYEWLEQLRTEQSFDYVLLAHHADDNLETLLFNFLRGTGLNGLTGMPEQNGHLLRPLLHVRRKQIEAFAKQNDLQWVEDSSNAENKYSRNFLRREIIPQLKTIFPQVDENLLHNVERMQGVQALYNESVAALKKKICVQKGEEVHLPVLRLLQYRHTSLPYEIIKDFGFGEGAVGELFKLAEAESGRYIASEGWRIIRHRRWFIIAPKAPAAQTFVIEKGDDFLRFGHQELRIRRLPKEKVSLDDSSQLAFLDARAIAYPLVLRKWKPGDYFYPLGMKKKKKLARFFIDLKLSRTEKENLWVLESHGRIAWVVGLRIDDRFKLTESTRDVLRLSLSNA